MNQYDIQKKNLIRTKIYIYCQGSSLNTITVLQGENYLWSATVKKSLENTKTKNKKRIKINNIK